MPKNEMRKILSLLLFIISVCSAYAEIKVTSFTPARSDMSAIDHPVLGTNGRACALVKVKTKVQGMLADALQLKEKPYDTQRIQTLIRIEQPCPEHSQELWLYFTTDTKRFRLMHPDYGLLTDGPNITNGYFVPQWEMLEGNTYVMEIELTENTMPQGAGGTMALPSLPRLNEVTLESDDAWMQMKIDDARLSSGTMILVPEGDHTFREGRFLNPKHSKTISVRLGEPLTINANPSAFPIAIFAGLELAKPTSQSEMGYGARLGIVGKWGLYGSFVRTWGSSGSFPTFHKESFTVDPVFLYSDPEVIYQSFGGGFIYRCYGGIHLYAGVGYGSNKVTWLKTDNKRYEVSDESKSGLTYEAGALINVSRFYLSGGAEYLDGNWIGHLGFGIYLKK